MKFSKTTADISALLTTPKTQDPPPQICRTDLHTSTRKPPRRRSPRATTTPRLPSKRDGAAAAPSAKRPGPSTPLLRWKFDERERRGGASSSARRDKLVSVEGDEVGARKLGAALWRFHSPEDGGGELLDPRKDEDRLGFKLRDGQGVDGLWSYHHGNIHSGSGSKNQDLFKKTRSVNGPINGRPYECSNYAMEGATKWDPVCAKVPHGNSNNLHFLGSSKENLAAVVSSLRKDLDKAQVRIEELETERKSSKKKMEHFLRKLSEERAAWRSREHEKVRAFIDDMKADLNRGKKSRQRLEAVNSKLVNDVAEAKLSAKRYLQAYEKERKARELIEEVCDELAKEIGEDKTEVEALKKRFTMIQEEVEEERKMLQMAEVWREERVQMKLVDAKVFLDEKYSLMNKIIEQLENFLRSRSVVMSSLDKEDMREVEMLRQAAASIKVQDIIKEFTYEPPNPDDDDILFSVFEQNEKEIVANSPPPAGHNNKLHRPCGDLDDDQSGWETVSQIEEDRDSSYSPDDGSRSISSVNRVRRDSNASESCMDWEINPCDGTRITEVSEVCCGGEKKQLKKVSPPISRLWRSGPSKGENYKIVSIESLNGMLSDVDGQWSSPPRLSNPHGGDRGKKGHPEWPLGMEKSSLKQKLLEARVESKKIQLRQALKQKI
ncbi:hypothetical protein Dimus_019135 [Dionaea muscipula]